jgi:uroporphyrinogen decarboxylase
MTRKERMLAALRREVPDRLPVTIHQWQGYHLQRFMGGVDQVEAFRATGLDASVTPPVGRFVSSDRWLTEVDEIGAQDGQTMRRHRVRTPGGALTWTTGSNEYTTFTVEHPVKRIGDVKIFLDHWPTATLDQAELVRWYDRTGDSGIVRGFVCGWAQPGVWQELCELAGTD